MNKEKLDRKCESGYHPHCTRCGKKMSLIRPPKRCGKNKRWLCSKEAISVTCVPSVGAGVGYVWDTDPLRCMAKLTKLHMEREAKINGEEPLLGDT